MKPTDPNQAGSRLAEKDCVPCKGGVPPLAAAEALALREGIPNWQIIDNHHLERSLKLSDFASALAVVNRIGALAEEQGHHPDIYLAWGKVNISIWTHKINGLTESDFVLAAKIDRLGLPA